ncbi:uncharacterized protein LOC117100896 [Anneissia japonica]|uniref:uncharacterized protein LOC117100896 n=1 Tax=Anneissia japonica TaxID=1529436 RepID=UPI0014257170|nr:uncharacterized protein LOC117100896 [Anneissia japonica]
MNYMMILKAFEFIASVKDSGNYQCKVENDAHREGKKSFKLTVSVIKFYLNLTFVSTSGTTTCSAVGHPEPSSVLIYRNWKIIQKGKCTATLKSNEEICKSNITCYAENGEGSAKLSLKSCSTGLHDSKFTKSNQLRTSIGLAVSAFILGSVPTSLICRYIHKRRERNIHLLYGTAHQYCGMKFKRPSGDSPERSTD